MKTPRLLWIGLALIAALMLAWGISGYVQENLILPALEFGWLASNYFKMIPQDWLWSLLLFIVFGIAALSLGAMRLPAPRYWISQSATPSAGRELAFWLARVHNGAYQRWVVAHHLAVLAAEMLRARGARIERGSRLAGPGWNPPEHVQKYLQAALYSSPPTFAAATKSAGLLSDPPVSEVIAYFETYMEIADDD
jgi:hypothetical protein